MSPTISNILLAVDVSERNASVIAMALHLAHGHGAGLRALHVMEPLTTTISAYAELSSLQLDLKRAHGEAREYARRTIGEQIEHAQQAQGTALVVEVEIQDGRPSEVILGAARGGQADLIVIGSHGHSTLSEVLIGSTAHRLSQRCPIPLLMVPVG